MCVEYKNRDKQIILSGGLLQSGCKMRDIHSVLYCWYELGNCCLWVAMGYIEIYNFQMVRETFFSRTLREECALFVIKYYLYSY